MTARVASLPRCPVPSRLPTPTPWPPLSYSVSRDVSVKKELAGRDLREGEFSFELLEGDDVVATATNAADGTVTFPELTYDAPGEHSYTVREVAGDAAGVSYDTTAHAVSVKVSDNGDGTPLCHGVRRH